MSDRLRSANAVIDNLESSSELLTVKFRSDSGRGAGFLIEFADPTLIVQKNAVGMLVAGLAELRSKGELHRFSFVNSDGNDDARLELDATALGWSVSW